MYLTMADREGGGQGRLISIVYLRGIAALIVVYDHLIGSWLSERYALSSQLIADFEYWALAPLNLMMHGGAFAVALFFTLSGFVIPLAAVNESRQEFLLKRALRIFPPLWASIFLLLFIYGILSWCSVLGVGGDLVFRVVTQPDLLKNVLASMTLSNYLFGIPAINGVAWSLVVEVFFYIWIFLVIDCIKNYPKIFLFFSFSFFVCMQYFSRDAGDVFFLLAVNSVYVSYMFIGTLIWMLWSSRISIRVFIVGVLSFWGLFLHGVDVIVAQLPYTLTGYGVSYGAAVLVFSLALATDPYWKIGRISGFFSHISYSLYLNHGGLGQVILLLLTPWLGHVASLSIAIVLVFWVSALSWRYIEMPSQKLARRIMSCL